MTKIMNDPKIAIVGIGGLFPESNNVEEYWSNIISKRDCIKEIGEDWDGYWRPEDHYDADPQAPDKTYSKKAGFIPEIEFNPMEFNMLPLNLGATSMDQLFSLVMAKRTLEDSGILEYCDKSRVGVILGVGESGNLAFQLATRTEHQNWKRILNNFGLPEKLVSAIIENTKTLYPEWQENSLPGFLGNVVPGRIANYFNFGGPNFSVNAACATSMAAIKVSISELVDGTCDVVLTGGVNLDTSILGFMAFTKTPVISLKGYSSPYASDCDGIMLGDGIGMMVLKRLEDAEKDGDKIYGVIRGIGTTSDGKADSIYAPKLEGQIRTLKQTYEKAGCDPASVGLVEGHGTGTIAGDLCEFQALDTVFSDIPKQTVALGSVKSQIGHTRVSAAVASIIKALMAINNKVLPPTINVEKPNPKFQIQNSAFYLNTESRPWIQPKKEGPRRAGVSSFGFGGTNFHVVLEEYENKSQKFSRLANTPDMIIIQATPPEKLLTKCENLLSYFNSDKAADYYNDYLKSVKELQINQKWPRIGFVSKSLEETRQLLSESVKQLKSRTEQAWDHPKGIYYRASGLDFKGRVVALFPGQGSQYLNMGSKLAQNYPEMRETFECLDDLSIEQGSDKISPVVFPIPCFDKETRASQKKELIKTQHAQPAICGVSAGFYKLLRQAGFQPDFIAGHSLGEITGLWAAGALEERDFLRLAMDRGKAMARENTTSENESTMLAITADKELISKNISFRPDLQIANYNAPGQIVVGGSVESIKALQSKLKDQGVRSVPLPVSAAFHTSFVAHAQETFEKSMSKTSFNPVNLPIYSNTTAEPYPKSLEEIPKTLSQQILSPVLFQQSIEKIHSQGGYLFVEIGPRAILSNLVKKILKDKEYISVALNPNPEKDEELQFRQAVVKLMVAGVELNDIDPYRIYPEPEKEKTDSQKRLSVKLNGGLYLRPDALKLRKQALEEKAPLSFEHFINQKTKPETPVQRNSSVREETPLMDQQDGLILTSSLKEKMENTLTPNRDEAPLSPEQQFHRNQENYLKIVSQIFQYQTAVIEKLHQNPNLGQILDSLKDTQKLLEKSQSEYNRGYSFYTGQGQVVDVPPASQPSVPPQPVARPSSTPVEAPKAEQPERVLEPVTSGADDTQAVNADNLIARLSQLIAEQTECQPGQIDPNANLEIDLGLDMFKALDILGVIHEEFGVDQETLEAMVELQTMSDIIEYAKKTFGGGENLSVASPKVETQEVPVPQPTPSPVSEQEPAVETPAPTPQAPPASTSQSQDAEKLIERILEIISEKTGYPTDMLGMDMDLNAELGVDSIKMVQILGTIQEEYPELEMGEDLEELNELRTIAQISEHIRQMLSSGSVESAAPANTGALGVVLQQDDANKKKD